MGGAVNGKHTHPRKHSVSRDTQDGWSPGQGSDAILTHVSVARPLTKLMSYVHQENAVWGWRSRQLQTHTNKHTHSVPRDTPGGWIHGQ